MSDGPFLVIANPTSGRGRGRGTAEAVATLLRASHGEVSVEYTQERGHAAAIAQAAIQKGGLSCLVACGGDGTVQEVAGALADFAAAHGGEAPALGLAPAGRCNDFVRAMGINNHPYDIARVLRSGEPVPVDLGRVNGKYFCTVATVGIDAEVSSYVDTMRLPLRGTPAYVYGAIRVLARYRAPRLRITGDFGEIDRELLLASTANTTSYGGAIQIAPHASATDGQLDLCLVDPMPRLRALRLLPQLMAGKHVNRPEVHFVRAPRVTMDSPRSLEVWADGERLANTPAVIEVVPCAVRVVCPRGGLHPR